MAIRILSLVLVLPLAACGIFPKEKTKEHADSPTDHNGPADGEDGSTDASGQGEEENPSVEIQQFLIVREPGLTASDAAAVLILKGNGSLEVSEIKGPKFLGNAAVGKLDEETSKKLFSELSSPLPEAQRTKLLADYQGAAIVYFKNYTGRLCSGGQYHLEVLTKVNGVAPTSVFDFRGGQGSDGNCAFQTLSLTTSYSETK